MQQKQPQQQAQGAVAHAVYGGLAAGVAYGSGEQKQTAGDAGGLFFLLEPALGYPAWRR